MRFARPTAVTLAVGWLMAACRYGPARAVPSKPSEGRSFRIEDVYRHFRGPESGIMVRRENLLSVMGYSVDRFPEPDAARNHYRPRTCFERVRFLVVHITDNADLEDTLRLYTANGTGNQMSAHYVVAKSTEADTDQMLIRVWWARGDADSATVPRGLSRQGPFAAGLTFESQPTARKRKFPCGRAFRGNANVYRPPPPLSVCTCGSTFFHSSFF